MEQTQYWMWTNKGKQYGMGSHHITPPSSTTTTTSPLFASTHGGGDSWEEQAFAEDAAAGALGGCVWPPRSYSCTFCKREFRSAQALGGHMNVHRRDRARLKQSQTPQNDETSQNNNNNNTNDNNSILLNQGTLLDTQSQYQTRDSKFVFTPNLDFDHHRVVATTSSPIRVSSPRLDYSNNNKTQYLFPYAQGNNSTIFPPKSSLINNNSSKQSQFLRNSVAEVESMAAAPSRDKGGKKRDIVKADLSISLNLVICSRSSTPSSSPSDEEEQEDGKFKRQRIDYPGGTLNLFNNNEQDYSEDYNSRNEVRKMKRRVISCIDGVDLELRLGDPPKVNE